MNVNEDTVRTAVASLLKSSILFIENSVLTGRYEDASNEAYHIHNLPGLLLKFNHIDLLHHWNIEIPEYMKKASPMIIKGSSKGLGTDSALSGGSKVNFW